jgi:hypothetical protein
VAHHIAFHQHVSGDGGLVSFHAGELQKGRGEFQKFSSIKTGHDFSG